MARREGKYDAVIGGLKPLPPDDAGYQDKVNRIKDEITKREPQTLAEVYIQLRWEKDEVSKALSAISLKIAAYEQLLAESKDAQADGWGNYGVKENALRLPTGETVRVQKEPYGKVIDKEMFRLWCMAPSDRCMTCGEREAAPWHGEPLDGLADAHVYKPGGGYARQLQLWPSTMNGVVKERLLAGEESPDGTEAFSYTKVVLVKAGAE